MIFSFFTKLVFDCSKSLLFHYQSIVELSVRMDTLDEQISQHQINKDAIKEEGSEVEENTSIQQLCRVKEELTIQKQKMDQLVETGGLLPPEERRLIELGEAIEAVEEALQYKNDLIARRQLTIAESDLDHYRNVEMLLDNMGAVSYTHLTLPTICSV